MGSGFHFRRKSSRQRASLREHPHTIGDTLPRALLASYAARIQKPDLRLSQGEPLNASRLRIETYFDAARIFRDGEAVVQLSGLQARILSELAQLGQPAAWEAVARDIWRDVPDRWTLIGALVIVGAGLYVWHRETRQPR